jgi:hypothetical protein
MEAGAMSERHEVKEPIMDALEYYRRLQQVEAERYLLQAEVSQLRELLRELAQATNLLLIVFGNEVGGKKVQQLPVSSLIYDVLARVARYLIEEEQDD